MLSRQTLAAALAVLTISAAAYAQDAKSAIDAASKAMGADTLKTVEFTATGYDFVLGQNYSPTTPWPKFTNKSYTRQIDFQVPSSKVDRVRMQFENPPRGGGQQPIRGEQPQSQTIIVGPNTPWIAQLELWMLPQGFLKAATANNATAKTQTVGGRKFTVLTFMGQNKAPVNGYINDQNLVERVETMIDNAYLGDTPFEAVYTDWKDFAGIKFPTHIVQRQGPYPIFDLTVDSVKPNAAVTIAAPAPQGGRGGAAPAAVQASGTPSEKLSDGVYLILGGYASIALDFKDYIVVIEGPQSDARANEVIAEAKRLIPNKPIRYVVNTHHHIDHSSGLRAFVAEGATVITHDINKAWLERVFTAPHTLNPDRLAMNPRKATIETMKDKKVLTDGNHVVELYHMEGNGHNAGLISVYLPKRRCCCRPISTIRRRRRTPRWPRLSARTRRA